MKEKINLLIAEINNKDNNLLNNAEEFRIKYLSKNGMLNKLFEEFASVSKEEKREIGVLLNELKKLANETYSNISSNSSNSDKNVLTNIDLTKPSGHIETGNRHPLSIIKKEINDIFSKLGFKLEGGPEIEDDWHNFSALNFPEEHPARDMQDTFFVSKVKNILLRTHTSSVQVRVMEKSEPPIKIIAEGRVYRNEAISARAHCIFHQVEGLYIDKNVSFADLKHTLLLFAKEMFGANTEIRLRPSFFPFTEPSAEMDITCNICGGKGCNICKHSGWVEILGCGMIHPNVLKNSNIDPEEYSGYAFGMGIERIAMLKFCINDLRLFFENDIRFLNQFKSFI